MKIKFCGITNYEDSLESINLNIDYIGFIIEIKNSPRSIKVEDFSIILNKLRLKNSKNNTKIVTVTQNMEFENLTKILDLKPDVLQLHGDENLEYIKKIKKYDKKIEIWKAFRVNNKNFNKDLLKITKYKTKVDKILLDKTKDLKKFDSFRLFLFLKEKNFKLILAGGLDNFNIKIYKQKLDPEIIDLSSSIEEFPGKKSQLKMKEFIKSFKKPK